MNIQRQGYEVKLARIFDGLGDGVCTPKDIESQLVGIAGDSLEAWNILSCNAKLKNNLDAVNIIRKNRQRLMQQ